VSCRCTGVQLASHSKTHFCVEAMPFKIVRWSLQCTWKQSHQEFSEVSSQACFACRPDAVSSARPSMWWWPLGCFFPRVTCAVPSCMHFPSLLITLLQQSHLSAPQTAEAVDHWCCCAKAVRASLSPSFSQRVDGTMSTDSQYTAPNTLFLQRGGPEQPLLGVCVGVLKVTAAGAPQLLWHRFNSRCTMHSEVPSICCSNLLGSAVPSRWCLQYVAAT
jgi:hypothetical protein